MIINKSGITIRLRLSTVRVMGRATQGVQLINLTKRGDSIGSVCQVNAEEEENAEIEVQDPETTETALNNEQMPSTESEN